MKIYTRTGDDGTTGLFGGDRVKKDNPRIAAYGTVDELNSVVGLIRAHLGREAESRIDALLHRIQNDLFVAGADLATPRHARPTVPRIDNDKIETLEKCIDELDDDLETLKTFVLPGGTTAASATHLARTVCRRAERSCVTFAATGDGNKLVAVYLNRLSDLFFVIARWINKMENVGDTPWLAEEE